MTKTIHLIEEEKHISIVIMVVNVILILFGFFVARKIGLNDDLKSLVYGINELTVDKGYKVINKVSLLVLWYSLARGITSDVKLYNKLMVLKANYKKFLSELNPIKFPPAIIAILMLVLLIVFILIRDEPYYFFIIYAGISILQHVFWHKYSNFLTKNIVRNFRYSRKEKKLANEILIRSVRTFLNSSWIKFRLWSGHLLNLITVIVMVYTLYFSEQQNERLLPLFVSFSILINILIQEGWIWYKRIIRASVIDNAITIMKKFKINPK